MTTYRIKLGAPKGLSFGAHYSCIVFAQTWRPVSPKLGETRLEPPPQPRPPSRQLALWMSHDSSQSKTFAGSIRMRTDGMAKLGVRMALNPRVCFRATPLVYSTTPLGDLYRSRALMHGLHRSQLRYHNQGPPRRLHGSRMLRRYRDLA